MAKRELSGRIAGLRFMQRAKEKEQRETEQVMEVQRAEENFWVNDSATVGRCTVIAEGDPPPDMTVGRLSFGNFNPTIEKLAEERLLEERRQRAAQASAAGDRVDVTDEEMAQRQGWLCCMYRQAKSGDGAATGHVKKEPSDASTPAGKAVDNSSAEAASAQADAGEDSASQQAKRPNVNTNGVVDTQQQQKRRKVSVNELRAIARAGRAKREKQK
eukprot:jgi/Chlat1/6476/Chrsp45S05971